MEKENMKFGLESQGYVAPRAENVEVAQECILCASPVDTVMTTEYEEVEIGGW